MGRRLIPTLKTTLLLALLMGVAACTHRAVDPKTAAQVALERAPIFDGHNDLAIHFANEQPEWSLERLNLAMLPGQSNLAKWRAGRVGGALVTTSSTLDPASPGQYASLQRSFAWFDALIARHPDTDAKVVSLTELQAARRAGRVGLIMAVEGGEQMERSVGNIQLELLASRNFERLFAAVEGAARP